MLLEQGEAVRLAHLQELLRRDLQEGQGLNARRVHTQCPRRWDFRLYIDIYVYYYKVR